MRRELREIVEDIKMRTEENPAVADSYDAKYLLLEELASRGAHKKFSDQDLIEALEELGETDPDEIVSWFEDLASYLEPLGR